MPTEMYAGPSQTERKPSLTALAQHIRAQMPITQHLQFSLCEDASGALVATAPLGPNANHQQSAFGGSLSMLATVAGWAMTTLLLREAHCSEAKVVIQKGSVDYRRPVRGDLCLRCERPARKVQACFFETLKRWGRARLSLRCLQEEASAKEFLETDVLNAEASGAEATVVFEGAYVALQKR